MTQLILGSASITRKNLMARLGLPFDCLAADIDESPGSQESAISLVDRLAEQKARAVLKKTQHQSVIIIASDEVMFNVHSGNIIGKPLDAQTALAQIHQNSGQLVHFYTGLYVLKQHHQQQEFRRCVITTEVLFARYSQQLAQQVFALDTPLQCAGAFRSEGASIRLCQFIKEPEPGALMGLPLLSLALFLRELNAPSELTILD